MTSESDIRIITRSAADQRLEAGVLAACSPKDVPALVQRCASEFRAMLAARTASGKPSREALYELAHRYPRLHAAYIASANPAAAKRIMVRAGVPL